jgi:hypothetical protein
MADHLVSLPNDPDQAQDKFDKFFSRLGYAITRWAHVDANLFEFCHFALGKERELTAAIFYRTPNIKDHLMLTDALMGYALRGKRLNKWKEIYKVANDHLSFRNALAHSPPAQIIEIIAVIGGKPKFDVPPPIGYWQISTDERKLLHKKGSKLKITIEDIVEHIKTVNRLIELMWALGKSLPKRRTMQRAKPPRQATPHPLAAKKQVPRGGTKRLSRPRSSRA